MNINSVNINESSGPQAQNTIPELQSLTLTDSAATQNEAHTTTPQMDEAPGTSMDSDAFLSNASLFSDGSGSSNLENGGETPLSARASAGILPQTERPRIVNRQVRGVQNVTVNSITAVPSVSRSRTISESSQPMDIPDWMLPSRTQAEAPIRAPKNITELAAYKTAGVQFDQVHSRRYESFVKKLDTQSIFEPLRQPINFSKRDEKDNFCKRNLLLPDLIDPKQLRGRVKDSYPRETFQHILKFARICEKQRTLAYKFSQLESTFILTALVRTTEAFLVLANLVQVHLNPQALREVREEGKERDLGETIVFAMNAIAQELYSIEPVLTAKVSERHSMSFEKKILDLFNERLAEAPTLLSEASLTALNSIGKESFAPKPLTYQDVTNIGGWSEKRRPKRKRGKRETRNSKRRKWRGSLRNKRDTRRSRGDQRVNSQSRAGQGSVTQANTNFKDTSIGNLNFRPSVNNNSVKQEPTRKEK